jgi:hypothetical protein
MATEHEIKFKASVDMSQANSQIQSAAQKFNIGLVRQAVNMFGKELETLAGNLGAEKFANALKETTDAANDAIRAFQAFGMAGAAIALGITAINKFVEAQNKAADALMSASEKINSLVKWDLERDFKRSIESETDPEKLAGMKDTAAAQAKRQRDALSSAQADLQSLYSRYGGKDQRSMSSEDRSAAQQLEATISNLVDGIKQAELTVDYIDSILENRKKESEAEAEKERREEERTLDWARKVTEQRKKELEENKQRSVDIFASFDKSNRLKGLSEALRGEDGEAKATAGETVLSELKHWQQVIEDFRSQLADGIQIDNNALIEAISNVKAFQDLADLIGDGEDKKDAEKQAKTLEKTLNAVSNLAAIGGQEAAGVKAQTNDYIKNIEYYVRKISEEGMNTGVIL